MQLGPGQIEVLRAVRAGQVYRDDCGGTRRGMWALYRLGPTEVGMTVRSLSKLRLITKPLLGPPHLTVDGEVVLRRLDRARDS